MDIDKYIDKISEGLKLFGYDPGNPKHKIVLLILALVLPPVLWLSKIVLESLINRIFQNKESKLRGWPADGHMRTQLATAVQNMVIKRLADVLPQNVTAPLKMDLQHSKVTPTFKLSVGKIDRPLTKGTTIIQAFDSDDIRSRMLILGLPGAGKTTMLLELAEYLIERAIANPAHPVPVILESSKWKSGELNAWMADELKDLYNLDRKKGIELIDDGLIMPLLDGLDELAQPLQEEFITKLNHFIQPHTRNVVVCSRSEEYERLSARLSLNAAVYINPIEDEVIGRYLNDVGCRDVFPVLMKHLPLLELARTPLFLGMIVHCRKCLNEDDLKRIGNTEEGYREYLFNTYLRERFGSGEKKEMAQKLGWLAWLSGYMRKSGETEFYIEKLQPTVLNNTRLYGLLVASMVALMLGLLQGVLSGLIFGLVFGICFYLVIIFSSSSIDPVEIVRIPRTKSGFMIISFEILKAIKIILIPLFFMVLAVGLTSILKGKPFELVKWLLTELPLLLAFGLIIGLTRGLRSLRGSIRERRKPNEGITRSAYNGLIYGLFASFILLIVAKYTQTKSINIAQILFYFFYFTLIFGGDAFIKHFSLRIALWWKGHLPFRLICFLDEMAELRILQKVGGGYRFLHLLLRDHIADRRWESIIPKDSSDKSGS